MTNLITDQYENLDNYPKVIEFQNNLFRYIDQFDQSKRIEELNKQIDEIEELPEDEQKYFNEKIQMYCYKSHDLHEEIMSIRENEDGNFFFYILPYIVLHLPKVLTEEQLLPFVKQHRKLISNRKKSNTHFPLFEHFTN